MKRILLFCVYLMLAGSTWAQSAKSDELFAKGVELYHQERYAEAIPFFEECDSLDFLEMDTTSIRVSYTSCWLSSCWYKIGNVQKAKEWSSTDYDSQPIDRRLTLEEDSLMDQALAALSRDDNATANKLLEQCIELDKKIAPFVCSHKIFMILYNTIALSGLNRTTEAIETLDLLYKVCQQSFSADNPLANETLKMKAQMLWASGQQDKAGEALGDLMEHLRSTGQEGSSDYLWALEQGVQLAFQMGDAEAVREGGSILLEETERQCGATSERYINQMGNVANMLSIMGDSTCMDVGQTFCTIVRNQNGMESLPYFNACALMVEWAGKMLRTDIIKDYLHQLMVLSPKMEPDHPENAHLFSMLLAMCYIKEDADSAAIYIEKGMDGLRSCGITDGPYYHMGRFFSGLIAGIHDDYGQAVALMAPSIDVIAPLTKDSVSLLQNKLFLSYFYTMNGDYSQGKRLGLETIESLRNVLSSPSMGGRSRGAMAHLSSIILLFDNARQNVLFSKADSVRYTYGLLHRELLYLKMQQEERLDSFDTSDFFNTLVKYGHTSFWTKDYLHTRGVVTAYMEKIKNLFGEKSWEYDRCLDALIPCYEDDDPMLKTVYEQQIALEQKLYGKRHQFTLATMRKYYKAMGDNEALMAVTRQMAKQGYINYGDDVSSMVFLSSQKSNDDYKSELKYYQEAFDYALKNKNDIYSLTVPVNGILSCLLKQGKTDLMPKECVSMMRQVEERRPALWNAVAFSVASYGLLTADDDTYEQCLTALNKAFVQLQNHPEQFACLLTARYHDGYVGSDKTDKAAQVYDRALAMAKPVNQRLYDELLLNKQKLEYYTLHHYHYTYSPSDILDMEQRADKMEQILQAYPDYKTSNDYGDVLAIQLRIALLRGDDEKATSLASRLWETVSSPHKGFFTDGEIARIGGASSRCTRELMSLEEKEEVLGEAALHIKDREFQAKLGTYVIGKQYARVREHLSSPFYRNSIQSDLDGLVNTATHLAFATAIDSLAGYAYDASIYCKGALLRSDKLMESHIVEHGNKTARQLLEELKQTVLLQDNVEINHLSADSLAERRRQLDQKLRDISNMFGDYTATMTASWRDVQKRLKATDAAIEFSQYHDGDTIRYCALVLRHDSRHPEKVLLCTDSQLAAIKDYYTTDSLYAIIWQPLEAALEGIETIYFSPTGQLHLIAVEDVKSSQDKRFSDRYRVYRLSNTRELIPLTRPKHQGSAYLVGGVEYEMTEDEWSDATRGIAKGFSEDMDLSRDSGSLKEIRDRGALTFLSGTEQEVKAINSQMQAAHQTVKCVMGKTATEDEFKNSAEAGHTIIHIATHGFYTPASDGQSTGSDPSEDTMMSRSGLLLAGALSFLNGDPLPENVDDGVLSAREISRLNLTSADLIALSACETGLGDVSGEGVFGLQRGFKKAGANSILMSLWKVDDDATCLLMTEFYKNWIGKGKTKHEALKLAKQSVRSHTENGWDDPKYWAAFILLDGLD